MDELVIRPAGENDWKAIYELELKCFADPWSESMFDAFKSSEVAECTVAELDGRICGYTCVYIIDGEPYDPCGDCELANIAVDPALRRKNIARRLLEHVYKASRARYCSAIYLEVRESNAAARGLYESEGFAVTGRRKNYYASPREDAVLMKKELAVE